MKQSDKNEQPAPVQAVGGDERYGPVLCSPFVEPHAHWRVEREENRLVRDESRRPAGYYPEVETGETVGQQTLIEQPELEELPLVNRLRSDVKRWRESGYRGASKVTRELLTHWRRDDRERRLFYCQLEAVETVIYLAEMRLPGRSGRTGFRKFSVSDKALAQMLVGEQPDFEEYAALDYHPTLIDPPADWRERGLPPLTRLGCKMATGSGKTVVMAMLIAWAFCNRGRNRDSAFYPDAALVVCPNLTVKERLQVLRPDGPGNYYEAFDLVPDKYREALKLGKVLVTNWHALAQESEHKEGDQTHAVVNKGEESPDAFARRVLGDLYDRRPVMVLNDEGHHAHRPPANVDAGDLRGLAREEKQAVREQREEATLWIEGLDRINQGAARGRPARPDGTWPGEGGVAFCVDLSATPYYLANSGHPEGRPFPWLVSDFGLQDAIESGIVKVPRLPVREDAGRPEPKFYRLWEHIKEGLSSQQRLPGASGKPKPEVVRREADDALQTLAGLWKDAYVKIVEQAPGEDRVPPVLIVVCDNTNLAKLFFEYISGEREEQVTDEQSGKTIKRTVYGQGEVQPEYLSNTEAQPRRTIRIDTKLLAEAEARAGVSKQDAAEQLREIVATVGQRGEPGEHVRCVVSVSMLTEGWDASNVTHVLGLRAFGSQLLCEQVIGRGLRRMSYEADENGMFEPEYVDVYGIPFSLIPFKGERKPQPQKPTIRVKALPERAHLEQRFPVVEGYALSVTPEAIRCDVDQVEPVEIDRTRYPLEVFVRPDLALSRRHEADLGGPQRYVEQTREKYYADTHPQQINFSIAMLVTQRLAALADGDGEASAGGRRARHLLFPQVYGIVRRYVAQRVRFNNSPPEELGLKPYVDLIVQRLADAVRSAEHSEQTRLMPVLNRTQPTGTTADVNFLTTKPTQPVERSHVSRVVADTLYWEQSAAYFLDQPDNAVRAFVKNDHLDLIVPYEFNRVPRSYKPDFVVDLENDLRVLLEVKGEEGEEARAKHEAAKRWVEAVNNWGGLGRWTFHVNRNPMRLAEELREAEALGSQR